MPDPTAHADDMKSLAVIEPNTSPAFWWVNPWAYALGLKRALDAVYLLSETTEDAYQAATTVIKQKQELADYHRTNLNDFQRKVELTLKPACPHLYEDTIGYVQWAADEIKSLRVCLSVMTEDRDEYIEKLDRERGTHEATLGYVRQLEEKVNHLEAKWPRDLWNGGKIYGDVYTCEPHAKAKRKVLAEDKTTGKKLLAPKKKGGRK